MMLTIFHPVLKNLLLENKANWCYCKDMNWIKIITHRVCLSSYPAGRCLWFRIFEENQTIPDQHHPGRAPIFPATRVYGSDKIQNRKSYLPSFIQTLYSYKCNVQIECNLTFLSLMGAACWQLTSVSDLPRRSLSCSGGRLSPTPENTLKGISAFKSAIFKN